MNSTFLNPVKIKIGDVVYFTEMGRAHLDLLADQYPILMSHTNTFKITGIRSRLAEDYVSSGAAGEEASVPNRDWTDGASQLQCVETGEILEITEDNKDYWAFFTEESPHYFGVKNANWN